MAPGKSGLLAHGEGERIIALESWEGTRASRYVEEGLSRSFSGLSKNTWVPSTCAGDLREILRVPLGSRDTVELGRTSRDSTGFGEMEEGLISSGGKNVSVPLHF